MRPKQLTTAEARAYHDDGFFVRAPDYSDAEMIELRAAAERSCRVAAGFRRVGRQYRLDGNLFVDYGHTTVQFEHAQPGELVRVIEPVHDLDSRFDSLVDDARLVEPMRELVGCSRIALWTAKLNLKVPGSGSGFGWHQDSPYWVHNSAQVDRLPNVMLAIDDADTANGCLRIVRGSHKRGCLPGRSDGSQLGGFFTDPQYFEETDQVCLEVLAGSLIFFSPHVVHGSGENLSDRPRRALIATYQPADQPALKSGCVRNVAGMDSAG